MFLDGRHITNYLGFATKVTKAVSKAAVNMTCGSVSMSYVNMMPNRGFI